MYTRNVSWIWLFFGSRLLSILKNFLHIVDVSIKTFFDIFPPGQKRQYRQKNTNNKYWIYYMPRPFSCATLPPANQRYFTWIFRHKVKQSVAYLLAKHFLVESLDEDLYRFSRNLFKRFSQIPHANVTFNQNPVACFFDDHVPGVMLCPVNESGDPNLLEFLLYHLRCSACFTRALESFCNKFLNEIFPCHDLPRDKVTEKF